MYKERNEQRQHDAKYYADNTVSVGYDYNDELCTDRVRIDKKEFDRILNELIKQQEKKK